MAEHSRVDLEDGSSYAAAWIAMEAKGFDVAYRGFSYSNGGSEPWRICFFGHPPNYWGELPPGACTKRSTDVHSVHLECIKAYYAQHFPADQGFTIKVEPHLRKPGDPPRPYSPDLAVFGPKGERMAAVEYQRSYEKYERFFDRDLLRRSEGWAAVDWWFDDTRDDPDSQKQTVYDRSQEHRTHLATIPVHQFRCWVDPVTLKFQGDYGRSGNLPARKINKIERKLETTEMRECSTAKVMRLIDGDDPEFGIIKEYREPLRARGTTIDFRADRDYSLERERRVAEAVQLKQARIEEEDRQRLEREHRLLLLTRIQTTAKTTSVLGEHGATNASHEWSTEELAAELQRLKALVDDAEEAWKAVRQEQGARYELLTEINQVRERRRNLGDVVGTRLATGDKSSVEQLQEELADEHKLLNQALQRREAADREALDRRSAEALMQEIERRQWEPVQVVHARRGQMAVNVRIGDRIRKTFSDKPEIYQGVSSAGFSTDRYTHPSLDGWHVYRGDT
jgi:hypothetical protein